MLLLASHTEVLKTDYGLLPQICFKILQIIDQGGPLMLPAFLCFLTISLFHFCSEMPFFCFSFKKWVVFDCIILCKDSKQLIATSGFLI